MNQLRTQYLDLKLWNNFGNRLLEGKDLGTQTEFLEACKSKDGFLEYITVEMQMEKFDFDSSVGFDYQFTEAEFCSPPEDTQKTIWQTFNQFNLPRHDMSDVCFWGRVMLDLIGKSSFEPEWLAANSNSPSEEGVYSIDSALKSQEERKLDKCVRRILRSLCNPKPRGKRIVFFDFPLGKSWWRYYWADRMSNHVGLDFERILEILDLANYQVLAERMHSNRSYISFPNIFGGLLLFLDTASGPINSKTLEKIVNYLAYLIIWKSIEMQCPYLICDEIDNIFSSIEL